MAPLVAVVVVVVVNAVLVVVGRCACGGVILVVEEVMVLDVLAVSVLLLDVLGSVDLWILWTYRLWTCLWVTH